MQGWKCARHENAAQNCRDELKNAAQGPMESQQAFTTTFYRASICEVVLGVVILSVCLSVCHTCGLWLIWMAHCRYFDTTRKGNHLLLWHQQWLVADAYFPLKCALKVTHSPSRNADFDRFPLITSQLTLRDSEKSSIMNIKSTTRFPTSYRWSAYVTPKSPKGGSKSDFFVFWVKVNGWSS